MNLTDENKGWMLMALRLGEDNMELFSESRWQHIAEPIREVPLKDQDLFTQYYIKNGGTCFDDLGFYVGYHNDVALEKTIEYAYDKIMEAFRFIETHFDIYSED